MQQPQVVKTKCREWEEILLEMFGFQRKRITVAGEQRRLDVLQAARTLVKLKIF